VGTKQLGIEIRIEPALTGIEWLLQRHKPAPVRSDYWVRYKTLDQAEWKDLQVGKQRRTLNVSKNFLSQFRQHPWRSPDADKVSTTLKDFLFSDETAFREYVRLYEAATASRGEFILAVSASPTAIRGLANVPWELTAEPGDSQRLIGLNPRVAFCRFIEKADSPVQVSHQGPLNLFYVISNQEPHFDQEAEAYHQALSDFGERKRPIVELGRPEFGMQPTYEDVVQSINVFSPHILIYVGHGRTTDKGVAQLKFEDWTNVHDLATRIVPECNQLFLVILISCDTSWTAALDPQTCGPQAFISRGVPAVVTMQSKISVEFADNFLDRLLASLFTGASLPRCVTVARQGDLVGAGKSPGRNLLWAAPALFVSNAALDVIQPLSTWKEAYAAQLSSIETSFPAVGEILPRRQLEDTVSDWLDKLTGVACIRGVFGAGRTTLISKVCRHRYQLATEQLEPPPRPIIYLNLGDIPIPSLAAVLSEVTRRSPEYGLPPVSYEGMGTEEQHLARYIGLQRVVLVLDDVDLLPPDKLQSLFKYCKKHLDHGLLILVFGLSTSTPIAAEHIPTLRVDPLSLDETTQYCATLVGQNGRLARQWHEISSGNLYLLHSLRVRGDALGLRPDSFLSPDNLRNAGETFVRALEPTLSPDLYDLLASIAVFPGGLSKNWLPEIFGSDANRLYSDLLSQGLVTSRQQYGLDWVQVPGPAGIGFENIEEMQSQRFSVLEKCRQFAKDLGPDWERVEHLPSALEDFPGFIALFRGLQALSLEIGQLDYAASLTRLLFQALRQLGRMSEAKDLIETLLASERMERWDSEDLLRLASALHALGDTAYLCTVLEYLEEYGIDHMEDYYKVTFWNLRANSLKDQGAVERTDEMLELYENAEALAQSYLPDADDRLADWLEQLAYTYHNRALTLRYMKRDLPAAQQALKQSAQFSQEAHFMVLKAKSDMERAEIELDFPGHDPDWSLVSKLLVSSRATFLEHNSRENLAFCLYQIARLEKKKPDPDLSEALARYSECYDEAKKAGFQRLAAIALRHRIELEWRQASIGFDEAIGALDSVIETLQHFTGDAWSTRVLRDAQLLAAQILVQEGKPEMAMPRLKEAWRSAFQAPLLPERDGSDHARAARTAVCWIELFGWSEDPELFSGLQLLLGDDWHEEQRTVVLSELKRISQEVE
jgi:hypothetical protein